MGYQNFGLIRNHDSTLKSIEDHRGTSLSDSHRGIGFHTLPLSLNQHAPSKVAPPDVFFGR